MPPRKAEKPATAQTVNRLPETERPGQGLGSEAIPTHSRLQHLDDLCLLIVEPLGRGKFAARLDGRLLVKSSRTPFLNAARALIAEGVNPSTVLVMRHAGSEIDALRARLGVAAGLTVREDRGAPEFVRHRAFALDDVRPGTAAEASPGVSMPEAVE